MNTFTTILTSTITTLVVMGIGFFGVTAVYAHGYGSHEQGGMHGKSRQHGLMSMVCSHKRVQKIEKGLVRLEQKLALDSEQTEVWNDLVAQINDSQTTLDNFCITEGEKIHPTASPDKLIKMQTMMGKATEIIGQVSPALTIFYATLDEDQKQILDNMGPGRHRRFAHHGMHQQSDEPQN